MSNYYLKDRNLLYKAKGLLSFMLSLPEDWDYYLAGLCSISKEGRDGKWYNCLFNSYNAIGNFVNDI